MNSKARRHATSVVPAAAVVLIVMSVVPALVVRGQSTPQTVRVNGLGVDAASGNTVATRR